MTVPVWTVTRRRGCVPVIPGLGLGEAGPGGDSAAGHVEEE